MLLRFKTCPRADRADSSRKCRLGLVNDPNTFRVCGRVSAPFFYPIPSSLPAHAPESAFKNQRLNRPATSLRLPLTLPALASTSGLTAFPSLPIVQKAAGPPSTIHRLLPAQDNLHSRLHSPQPPRHIAQRQPSSLTMQSEDDRMVTDDGAQTQQQTQSTQQASQVDFADNTHLWGYLIPCSPNLRRIDFQKIKSSYSIGRNREGTKNDIIFPGMKISNFHCVIEWDKIETPSSAIKVTDLSSNGTYSFGVSFFVLGSPAGSKTMGRPSPWAAMGFQNRTAILTRQPPFLRDGHASRLVAQDSYRSLIVCEGGSASLCFPREPIPSTIRP
uniref:Lysine--tRNA ligase ) n=1 Tax=Ganoderma boninense TaxID=34458 RepID=A0A5K1K6S1_9APHY|nr:Lysine--tRNA ligase (EC (Lysyl-tRNA synthetase) [Ganoderma boninense]